MIRTTSDIKLVCVLILLTGALLVVAVMVLAAS